MNNDIVVSVRELSKDYPGVKALDKVSLDIRKGEVHALIGENGAGKSTLIKMIAGAEHPDSGTIEIFGQQFTSLEPLLSKALGIATIYQEFNLFPDLTIYENIFMGEKFDRKVFPNLKQWEEDAKAIFKEMNVKIKVNKRVAEVTTAYMQLIEIAKAIAKDSKILIMDEPTAPLSNVEVDALFALIRHLKKKGVTIIYISHRMGEIFDITDRITVMRDGKKIITLDTDKTNRLELIHHMVNRDLGDNFPKREINNGDVVLEARHLCGNSSIAVKDVSFKLHGGEILGLGGLVGAGRTEVSRLLFGSDKLVSGEILIDGKLVNISSPKKAVLAGIGLVPEDRKQHGAIQELSIRENISLPIIKRISNSLFLDTDEENKRVVKQRDALSIKTPSLNQFAKNLSGGNQQKVVLAKWLASGCRILILDEPTRGVDVGAKQEIYKLIYELADQGIAILLVTTEMEELLGLCDRLLILSEGSCMGFIERNEFSQKSVLELASGNM